MPKYSLRWTGAGLAAVVGLAIGGLALSAWQPVSASSGGRTGASGNPATGGQTCNRCHSGGTAPDVTLDGPTLVSAGATNSYTLTISGGQSVAGGFDVSTTGGMLAALLGATDVQARDDEVTHTGPKAVDAMGQVIFRFLWTAPDAAGEVTLYGAGNSVNGDGGRDGDAASATTLGITVEAGGSTPTPEPTPESPYEVAFADLNNPHGVTALDNGQVLIGEGGTAGDSWQPGEFGPGAGDGRILQIALDTPTQREVLVDKMTNSVDPGGGVVGGNHAIEVQLPGATTQTATVTLVAQAGGPAHTRPEEAAKILMVDAEGKVEVFADPLAYEREHNPDGAEGEAGIDSNPWRLVLGPDGRVYVVDAGANDILALDLATRELSTWAVFPELTPGQQAVPTGLAFDPADDTVAYVSLLGPFGPGTTELHRLEDMDGDGDVLGDGEHSVLITGLKTATDIAVGDGGDIFFTEIFPGTLSRLDPACWSVDAPCGPDDRAVVADQLPGASALAFLANGDALVTTTSQPNPEGPSLNTDRVVRILAEDLVPPVEPTATPSPTEPTEPTATPKPTTPPDGEQWIYLPMVMREHLRQ